MTSHRNRSVFALALVALALLLTVERGAMAQTFRGGINGTVNRPVGSSGARCFCRGGGNEHKQHVQNCQFECR